MATRATPVGREVVCLTFVFFFRFQGLQMDGLLALTAGRTLAEFLYDFLLGLELDRGSAKASGAYPPVDVFVAPAIFQTLLTRPHKVS